MLRSRRKQRYPCLDKAVENKYNPFANARKDKSILPDLHRETLAAEKGRVGQKKYGPERLTEPERN